MPLASWVVLVQTLVFLLKKSWFGFVYFDRCRETSGDEGEGWGVGAECAGRLRGLHGPNRLEATGASLNIPWKRDVLRRRKRSEDRQSEVKRGQ
ncbi:uncharacterized protein B0H64DRAFT_218443 [Chaetomium fimeti]|uniref:Secreted protein n=1 Tax=Chaetomium fimeti TaxID=1854472 RepID=A0AAE0HCA8_9PEZI|nr:hypothetical protein B0H64DRAFT_218443 [Chaetomium fimeti]